MHAPPRKLAARKIREERPMPRVYQSSWLTYARAIVSQSCVPLVGHQRGGMEKEIAKDARNNARRREFIPREEREDLLGNARIREDVVSSGRACARQNEPGFSLSHRKLAALLWAKVN
ncbi:hypothetical protein KM043_004554 [Ampulex compressa]|nr:hypothetical protein KM043_004554 [Ampulex compressa]